MSPASAPPRRVLYAEDDRVAALLFTEALRERSDYEVQVAEDGIEALAVARDWQPDVLVLDAHLPDTSGLALLAQLRQLAGLADVPAFICSADEHPEDQQRHLSAGFCGYWVKPVDRQRLLSELDRLPLSR